jgi:glyoxylase-like metal-dependent hydrolase (beta-lactamase superfamily II)
MRERNERPASRGVIAGALLLSALLLGAAATPPHRTPTHATAWRIEAIRYATVHDFPVAALVTGADTTRRTDIAMMFWHLQGPAGRHVLLDAGFYRQKFLDDWKPANFVRPSEALAATGTPADSVTDIVVSHVHWDHLDGADLFPRARVWIQRAEYEYYVGANGQPLHSAIDTVDAEMLATLRRAGRVRLIAGDGVEILPGIRVYTGGKHTFASQYAGVRTAAGTVVLASDNLYLFENLERHRPIAQTLDSTSNLAAQERMKKIATAVRLIVPGHDPAVFERFPSARAGVARIE